MTQEALKLALEALEGLIKKTSGQAIYSFMETERRIAMSACVGIKEALRENAMREVQRLGQEIEQEPVAWMHIQGRHQELSHFPLDDGEISRGWEQYPLYTAPPQRKPLTDEEYFEIGQRHWLPSSKVEQIYYEIEAKLKENT